MPTTPELMTILKLIITNKTFSVYIYVPFGNIDEYGSGQCIGYRSSGRLEGAVDWSIGDSAQCRGEDHIVMETGC